MALQKYNILLELSTIALLLHPQAAKGHLLRMNLLLIRYGARHNAQSPTDYRTKRSSILPVSVFIPIFAGA